jgi:predicted nucleotidyltransferase
MTLSQATTAANRIVAELSPLCRSIEVYGSVAAGSETPGDIDINLDPISHEALRRHIRRRALIVWENVSPPIWRINWPGVGQVDLFLSSHKSAQAG